MPFLKFLNDLVLWRLDIFNPFQISNNIAVKVISIIHRTVPATNNTKYNPLTDATDRCH